MFGDIAGFTAWSSVREPSQVFTLLETVYAAFDVLAKRRRVFKVETVGDCYVAVTGLPEPRRDHAIVMCRFARDCVERFNELAGQLETILGPDTGDLALRGTLFAFFFFCLQSITSHPENNDLFFSKLQSVCIVDR